MATLTHEMDICVDCLMAGANGLQGWEYSDEWLDSYNKAREWYGAEPTPSGDENEEGYFSWTPCGFCNSTLGGDRYPAVILR